MTKNFNPFFINSNIYLGNKPYTNLSEFANSVCHNTGNSYITYSLIKELYGKLVKVNHIPNIYTYNFDNADYDIDFINTECSHVFLILQDQIRITESYNLQLPYENIINFIKKLNKPVIIAGLGSNFFEPYESSFYKKLNPNIVKYLHELSDYSEIIGIRGACTADILDKLSIKNIQIIGCPSFYEMGRDRIITKKPFDKNLKIILSNEWSNAFELDKDIILQDEKELIGSIAFPKKDFSKLSFNQLILLKNKKYYTFSSIKSWKNFVSNYDFMMGTRVHGAILALNSGTCSIIMNGDTRAKEMADFLKIPYRPDLYGSSDIKKIYEACDYTELNKNYPKLYDNYIDFLNKNGIDLSETIKNNENTFQQKDLQLYKHNSFSINKTLVQLQIKTRIKTRINTFKERTKRTFNKIQNNNKLIFKKILRVLNIKK